MIKVRVDAELLRQVQWLVGNLAAYAEEDAPRALMESYRTLRGKLYLCAPKQGEPEDAVFLERDRVQEIIWIMTSLIVFAHKDAPEGLLRHAGNVVERLARTPDLPTEVRT